METCRQLILVNGNDRTDSIVSCRMHGSKCDIVFRNSPRVYSYNSSNIRILKLQKTIDPRTIVCKVNGCVITGIACILDFGPYYRVVRPNRQDLSYRREEVELLQNCLSDADSKELFQYFKDTAQAVSLVSDNGLNILSMQYDKISAVEDTTVLAKYLDNRRQPESRRKPEPLIYPFGLNQSQKTAVENAFSSQVSIIQGPPGTGKTQTILNIIANAVRNGKTVAVVSNNNSATSNVAEKLAKKDLSFLTAFLGSLHNKEVFLMNQTGQYPDMPLWVLEKEVRQKLDAEVAGLSEELNIMLESKNRIAVIDQELLTIKPEQYHFSEYYDRQGQIKLDIPTLKKLTSGKLVSLWLEYEDSARRGKKLSLWKKLGIAVRFSRAAVDVFQHVPQEAIPFIQDLYYKNKIAELQKERKSLEAKLRGYHFEAKMQELSDKSMRLFKAELADRYSWQDARQCFEKKSFRNHSKAFNQEYPVILSTTYSIKGTLSTDHVYDYLIIDEASQVDLATGVLAFSCARNVVIVGDQKQLPNVLTEEDVEKADQIWNRHHFDERYHFATHSLLVSAAEVWERVPSTLLREHYRCHPKIAGFFNQKFYDGKLIVMTQDQNEPDVLTMYRTSEGNHARGHINQRQIDVIRQEILPGLHQRGYESIGIVTPYRDQVAAIKRQLGNQYEVATVHKFQGREKDAIILVSVDDVIGEFVDDPNMLNVAVSRAVKSLTVVISGNKQNEKTNYGDLARYIEYNNFQIIDSSVYSVFDLLYKQRYAQRQQYLQKHKRISEYDSENLAFSVIEKILKMPEFARLDCVMHASLATLVKDYSALTEWEARYASNPLTHIDFLLFNRMDKTPVLAIEIDGVSFHKVGTAQADRDGLKNSILGKCRIPLLRIYTNESNEEDRIVNALRNA